MYECIDMYTYRYIKTLYKIKISFGNRDNGTDEYTEGRD